MKVTRTAIAVAFVGFGSGAMAADANNPDAVSVTNAMYAAVGVGNVDAAVSYFGDEGYNIGPGGKKTMGKDALRSTISSLWLPENVQIGPGRVVGVRGNETILSYDISTAWIERLGVSVAHQMQIVTLDGNKIRSINAWYTAESLDELTKACEAKPDAEMPPGMPSCGKVVSYLRRYTDSMNTQRAGEVHP